MISSEGIKAKHPRITYADLYQVIIALPDLYLPTFSLVLLATIYIHHLEIIHHLKISARGSCCS